MTTRTLRIALLALMVAALPLLAPAAHAGVFVGVAIAPPVAPAFAVPVCPGDGYIWAPGYWAYGPDGYYWVDGSWVEAPYEGSVWTPGYWGYGAGGWFWNVGFWGYGGYGWGWGGYGFYRGGVFLRGPGYVGFHGFHEGIFVHTSYGGALYHGGVGLTPHWTNHTLTHTANYNHGAGSNGSVHAMNEHGATEGNRGFAGAENHTAAESNHSFAGGERGAEPAERSVPTSTSRAPVSRSYTSHASSGGGHSGGGGHR